jgi:hypothetical protein
MNLIYNKDYINYNYNLYNIIIGNLLGDILDINIKIY